MERDEVSQCQSLPHIRPVNVHHPSPSSAKIQPTPKSFLVVYLFGMIFTILRESKTLFSERSKELDGIKVIRVKTEFETCQEVLISSTATMFNFLIEDIPFTKTKFLTPLADRGIYVATRDDEKLLRIECEKGKNVLLHELEANEVTPKMLLELYLTSLFLILEKIGVKEKTEATFYVRGEFVVPQRIRVVSHPLGFMRGEYTLFDKIIASNYRALSLEPKPLPIVLYNPLHEFDNIRLANTIVIFERNTREELSRLEFKTNREAKEVFRNTTHYHINEVFFGYIKFKIRKVLGI
ncbi:hypothetical protein [Thermococcus sp.]